MLNKKKKKAEEIAKIFREIYPIRRLKFQFKASYIAYLKNFQLKIAAIFFLHQIYVKMFNQIPSCSCYVYASNFYGAAAAQRSRVNLNDVII